MNDQDRRLLTNSDELLLRQVHPIHLKGDGTISKEAFNPSKRDSGLLSTLRGHIGAEEAYRRWTQDMGYQSIGTYGVSVGEVDGVFVGTPPVHAGLRAYDDSDQVGVPDHASVDYNAVPSRGLRGQAARKLLKVAEGRGRLHP